MICPKCTATMKTFDRLGIHVEQCESCRGIFLDYGELEQIVSMEQQHAGPPPPLPGTPAGQGYRQDRGYRPDSPKPYGRGHSDSPRPYRGGYGDSPRPYGRKKKSIFEQLFD